SPVLEQSRPVRAKALRYALEFHRAAIIAILAHWFIAICKHISGESKRNCAESSIFAVNNHLLFNTTTYNSNNK
ncbi:hypothetical protein, partial [Prevotellamassilia timonensis]|uniref:hypothetical protein n=1 Tax=Prevotellamassilia timonensis TaxID=1852370 RepID=UPI00307EAA42